LAARPTIEGAWLDVNRGRFGIAVADRNFDFPERRQKADSSALRFSE
jgi:hypothetical protein